MVNFGIGTLKKHWKKDWATLSALMPPIPWYAFVLLNSVG